MRTNIFDGVLCSMHRTNAYARDSGKKHLYLLAAPLTKTLMVEV